MQVFVRLIISACTPARDREWSLGISDELYAAWTQSLVAAMVRMSGLRPICACSLLRYREAAWRACSCEDSGSCTPDWSAMEMNFGMESEVLLEVEAADVTRRWSDPRSSEGRDEVGAASSSRHNTCDLHVNTLQSGSTRRHHGSPSECTTRAVFRTKWLREQPSSVWAHCPPS